MLCHIKYLLFVSDTASTSIMKHTPTLGKITHQDQVLGIVNGKKLMIMSWTASTGMCLPG